MSRHTEHRLSAAPEGAAPPGADTGGEPHAGPIKAPKPRRGADSGQAGVQSVEIGARVLKALAEHGGVLPLKKLATATRMPRGKVHRYLVSLKRAGLVAQDSRSGDYRIGPAAVTLGLVGLHSLSPVRHAHEALPALRDRVQEPVTMAIWGEMGPTIIAMEETSQAITINLRVGSALPILRTSIGRVFAAFLPPAMTAQAIERERRNIPAGVELPSEEGFAQILSKVRRRRMASTKNAMLPGFDALAAPVLDYSGRLVAVVCVFGRGDSLDIDIDGRHAKALRDTVDGLSRQLGYVPLE
jgi:DNA-binding IclR family transcriptional regulator